MSPLKPPVSLVETLREAPVKVSWAIKREFTVKMIKNKNKILREKIFLTLETMKGESKTYEINQFNAKFQN